MDADVLVVVREVGTYEFKRLPSNTVLLQFHKKTFVAYAIKSFPEIYKKS